MLYRNKTVTDKRQNFYFCAQFKRNNVFQVHQFLVYHFSQTPFRILFSFWKFYVAKKQPKYLKQRLLKWQFLHMILQLFYYFCLFYLQILSVFLLFISYISYIFLYILIYMNNLLLFFFIWNKHKNKQRE